MSLNNLGWWVYPHETSPDDVPRGRGDNMRTTFGRPTPKNLGGSKNVQISARFLTTFEFDRKYLRNGSTYRTSEKKELDQPEPHPRWAKTIW